MEYRAASEIDFTEAEFFANLHLWLWDQRGRTAGPPPVQWGELKQAFTAYMNTYAGTPMIGNYRTAKVRGALERLGAPNLKAVPESDRWMLVVWLLSQYHPDPWATLWDHLLTEAKS